MKLSIGTLGYSNHSLPTCQCRTANHNTFSASESRLDIYLHCTGRLLPQSVFFTPYICNFNLNHTIISTSLQLVLLVSLSNAMTLHSGVSRAALDFWGFNHKTFDKSVILISSAPQNHVLINLIICSFFHVKSVLSCSSLPAKIVILQLWHFNILHSYSFWYPRQRITASGGRYILGTDVVLKAGILLE